MFGSSAAGGVGNERGGKLMDKTQAQIMIIIALFYLVMVGLAIGAAYRNGVTDGYGACREPGNPGYEKARRYLKKYMSHRWNIE